MMNRNAPNVCSEPLAGKAIKTTALFFQKILFQENLLII